MVRDGMGWFTRWGLISHLWVDYGWSVNQKMVVAISNLSYAVSGSLLAPIQKGTIFMIRDGMGWFTRWG